MRPRKQKDRQFPTYRTPRAFVIAPDGAKMHNLNIRNVEVWGSIPHGSTKPIGYEKGLGRAIGRALFPFGFAESTDAYYSWIEIMGH